MLLLAVPSVLATVLGASAPLRATTPDITNATLELARRDVVAFAEAQMSRFDGPAAAMLRPTFNQTFTFTAMSTWNVFADGTVFIDTGDIHQQWLRDSANQMQPYLPVAKTSAPVRSVFVKAIQRMVRFFVDDNYASAFNPTPEPEFSQCPRTLECPECTCNDCAPSCSSYSYQHNYEMDGICYVVDLAHRFWSETNSTAAFDTVFHAALQQMVDLFTVEQDHTNRSPYRFGPVGVPNATAKVGLLWGHSRPSDDRDVYNYNVPQNMWAVVTLGKVAEIATEIYGDEALARDTLALRDSVDAAIQQYAVFEGNLTVPRMYAFEVDGFGGQVLMDDANMPNLLSIPFMGYPDKLGLYNSTRSFVLRPQHHVLHLWSPGNPYFYKGQVATGLGSAHQSHGLRPLHRGAQCFHKCVWPLGLIMEALTTTDGRREQEILRLLLKTDAGTHYMHEGFSADNATEYNRDLFGWANSLFATWVLESRAVGQRAA